MAIMMSMLRMFLTQQKYEHQTWAVREQTAYPLPQTWAVREQTAYTLPCLNNTWSWANIYWLIHRSVPVQAVRPLVLYQEQN